MSRHPYTYAADYIRQFSPIGPNGVVLSRADASQIRQGIARALGMDDHEMACRLSEYFQANENEITEESVKRLVVATTPFAHPF